MRPELSHRLARATQNADYKLHLAVVAIDLDRVENWEGLPKDIREALELLEQETNNE